jgi:histidinol dehydrogenase
MVDAVCAQLDAQLADLPRAEIARASLAAHGVAIVVPSIGAAIDFANRYAPEHLSVMTTDPGNDARRVNTAGTTFVGPSASVAFGDYLTGANHVLPTGGRARSFSGLSTLNYLRSYTIQEIGPEGARSMADDVATLAAAEGLPAHAEAALARGRPS